MSVSLDAEVKDYFYGRTLVPDGQKAILCQKCGVFRPKKVLYDGTGESVLCDMCLARNQGLAYLMCRCGKFLGFYKPGRVRLDSGVIVEVEAGDTLHTSWCSSCNPKEPSADIEEFKAIMDQKNLNAPRAPLLDAKGQPLKVEGM